MQYCFKLWHPRYVLITIYEVWYQVVKTQLFKFISYMMEVAGNYMFRPLWWPSSGYTSKRKSKWLQRAKNFITLMLRSRASITAHYIYAPHVYRIGPFSFGKQTHHETGSHLLGSIIQRHSSLPRTTGFQELGTPCHPSDSYSSLDRYYLICMRILLRCSRSRHQSYKSFFHIVLIYSYSSMYNLMMATTKAETCSFYLPPSYS